MIACSGVFFTSCDGDGSSSNTEIVEETGLQAGDSIILTNPDNESFTINITSANTLDIIEEFKV